MSAFYTSTKERLAAAPARAKVRKLAQQLGVVIEARLDGGWHEIILTAPDGYWFAGAEIHEIIIANAGSVTDGLWQRCAETLALDGPGVEPHNDPDCEWCHEESV